ncbi:MAG: DUF4301 family protein [Crocinitomicaceae bacterium]|nr:DUF4301 family protein [Crocinitomicaceae bacterium]
MLITKEDEIEIERRGLKTTDILTQIRQFTHELKPVKLERPCTQGDGIHLLRASECHRLMGIYDTERARISILKFVPASGAATRMFKHLFNYKPDAVAFLTEEFILQFNRLPFYNDLKGRLQSKGIVLDELKKKNDWGTIFEYILEEKGLDYANFPKGLIPFHKYGEKVRTAFEEHLHETIIYGRDKNEKCRIHFSLSSQFTGQVTEFIRQKIEDDFPYEDFEITHSIQSESTDTVALGKDNLPVRDDDGRLIFRPSGHGSLIFNLEQLQADVIFVKNIDNVTTDDQREDTVFFKKVIGGLLITLKSQINQLLNRLENSEETSVVEEVMEFIQQWFQPGLPLGLTTEEMRRYAILLLDRPLRVCGMVRNEGEPGGGPFWVRMSDGHLTKQIVEKSQVDVSDIQQNRLFAESTHFNPVDIVCSIRNRKGENYSLKNYIDHSTGFISEKFHDGKVIQALELPGLWNGAMALWNTVFIEVPCNTFTPVKTVNDLLRSGHQSANTAV